MRGVNTHGPALYSGRPSGEPSQDSTEWLSSQRFRPGVGPLLAVARSRSGFADSKLESAGEFGRRRGSLAMDAKWTQLSSRRSAASISADVETAFDQVLWVIARAVSSAGEHCAYNAGVGGSNPSPPTTKVPGQRHCFG